MRRDKNQFFLIIVALTGIAMSFQNCADPKFTQSQLSVVEGLQTGIAILEQPSAAGAVVGQFFSLKVVASGKGRLGYQWFKNSKSISGAQSDSLVFSSLSPSDAGNYEVEVFDENGERMRSELVFLLN